MITYKLLDDSTGVILTRQPLLCGTGELSVRFEGAPEMSVVIFESDGKSYYRDIVNEGCSAPVGKFGRDVHVTVARTDSTVLPYRWRCEGWKLDRVSGGEVLICPDDTNLPDEVVRIRLENQNLRQDQARAMAMIAGLATKLDRIMEGYDLT